MAKVYKTASGARDPSGRDLVFEAWFEDNIARVEGGRLEQRSIYKAYRQFQRGDRALGEQGVERMLNQLKVQRQVRQGKTYRLGVGFKSDVGVVSTPATTPARTAPAGEVDSIEVTMAFQSGALALPSDMLRIASGLGAPESCLLAIPDASDGTSYTAIAMNDVLSERLRQRAPASEGGEGFDAAHDDASDPGAHERAMACYAYAAAQPDRLAPFVETNAKQPRDGKLGWLVRDLIVMMWPWASQWWKPQTDRADWKRRCLVKACALGLAAIERIDREKARATLEASQAKDMTGV